MDKNYKTVRDFRRLRNVKVQQFRDGLKRDKKNKSVRDHTR